MEPGGKARCQPNTAVACQTSGRRPGVLSVNQLEFFTPYWFMLFTVAWWCRWQISQPPLLFPITEKPKTQSDFQVLFLKNQWMSYMRPLHLRSAVMRPWPLRNMASFLGNTSDSELSKQAYHRGAAYSLLRFWGGHVLEFFFVFFNFSDNFRSLTFTCLAVPEVSLPRASSCAFPRGQF